MKSIGIELAFQLEIQMRLPFIHVQVEVGDYSSGQYVNQNQQHAQDEQNSEGGRGNFRGRGIR